MRKDLKDIRIRHLVDNIRQDLELLKDYEDALRYEDDPLLKAKYRRDIERYRDSWTHYQLEYNMLQSVSEDEMVPEMRNVVTLLGQMDTKLDELLGCQKAVLARFDASEQIIIASVVKRLDQNQMSTVQSVLNAIEANQISKDELESSLNTFQLALSEIHQERKRYDPKLLEDIERISEMFDDPEMNLSHKLKVTIPIIPLILA